jgi:hypothetical protein
LFHEIGRFLPGTANLPGLSKVVLLLPSESSERIMDMIERSGENALRRAMHELLRGGTVVVLASIAPDGTPSTALCSWIVAKGPQRLALALDKRSSAYTSIAAGSNQIALEVMADDILLSIRGRASIEKDSLESVPFPCALVSLDVLEIRDHMLEGVRFHGPHYAFARGKEHRTDVERKIFDELNKT